MASTGTARKSALVSRTATPSVVFWITCRRASLSSGLCVITAADSEWAAWATTRQEADEVEIYLVFLAVNDGDAACLLIRNRGQRSADYEQLQRTPRQSR